MSARKRWAAACVLALSGCGAHAQSCNVTAASASTSGPYNPFGGNGDAQGSVSFTCTRPSGSTNPFPSVFWVGVSGANAHRTLQSGASTLEYALHTSYPACSTAWQGATGLMVANNATQEQDSSTGSLLGTFCFRIPSGQLNAQAGSYHEASPVVLSIRSNGSTGFLWGTSALSLTSPVDSSCSFVTAPAALTIPYTSFQATPASVVSSFDLRCTNGTAYTLALDAPGGSLLGLDYSLQLATLGGSGTGTAQPHTIRALIPAGLAGRCGGTGGCNASKVHTITISY